MSYSDTNIGDELVEVVKTIKHPTFVNSAKSRAKFAYKSILNGGVK
ncbi:MAG: hypothetical protein ACRD92_08305 [Nitrosopumilaceae archaeon]